MTLHRLDHRVDGKLALEPLATTVDEPRTERRVIQHPDERIRELGTVACRNQDRTVAERLSERAVVVSHDRWFLDRLATHILAFEGDGYVHWCEGNFQTYENQRRERLGESADEPKRFRYKKLQHG